MSHELLGVVLRLRVPSAPAWRITSVQFGKASCVSLATGRRHQESVEAIKEALETGRLYVSE
jgi:hypothetical protein